MGRNINPYDGPLSREDYQYLKSREQQFMIAENVKHFGPLGQVEGHEWTLDEDEGDPVHESSETTKVNEEPTTDYDPDDIAFVDSVGYSEWQSMLKQMDLPASGDKVAVRQRLLDAIKERGGVREAVDLDDDKDEDEE